MKSTRYHLIWIISLLLGLQSCGSSKDEEIELPFEAGTYRFCTAFGPIFVAYQLTISESNEIEWLHAFGPDCNVNANNALLAYRVRGTGLAFTSPSLLTPTQQSELENLPSGHEVFVGGFEVTSVEVKVSNTFLNSPPHNNPGDFDLAVPQLSPSTTIADQYVNAETLSLDPVFVPAAAPIDFSNIGAMMGQVGQRRYFLYYYSPQGFHITPNIGEVSEQILPTIADIGSHLEYLSFSSDSALENFAPLIYPEDSGVVDTLWLNRYFDETQGRGVNFSSNSFCQTTAPGALESYQVAIDGVNIASPASTSAQVQFFVRGDLSTAGCNNQDFILRVTANVIHHSNNFVNFPTLDTGASEHLPGNVDNWHRFAFEVVEVELFATPAAVSALSLNDIPELTSYSGGSFITVHNVDLSTVGLWGDYAFTYRPGEERHFLIPEIPGDQWRFGFRPGSLPQFWSLFFHDITGQRALSSKRGIEGRIANPTWFADIRDDWPSSLNILTKQ